MELRLSSVNVLYVFCRMVEQKLPERAITLFMKACEVAEVGPYDYKQLCKCIVLYTVFRKKRNNFIFDYNSRVNRLNFIIFVPLETGMNTP